jgi:hypothetical protein
MGDWKPTRSKPEAAAPGVGMASGLSVVPSLELPKLSGGNTIAADSLARVGGYLGGVQSPAVLACKQTAKNTAETVKLLRRISVSQTSAVFA